jgi:hypothetical protein
LPTSASNIAIVKEDLSHVEVHPSPRAPPSLANSSIPTPRWEEIPPQRQEELLRLLGRMLASRLDRDDGEVRHDQNK